MHPLVYTSQFQVPISCQGQAADTYKVVESRTDSNHWGQLQAHGKLALLWLYNLLLDVHTVMETGDSSWARDTEVNS